MYFKLTITTIALMISSLSVAGEILPSPPLFYEIIDDNSLDLEELKHSNGFLEGTINV